MSRRSFRALLKRMTGLGGPCTDPSLSVPERTDSERRQAQAYEDQKLSDAHARLDRVVEQVMILERRRAPR